MRINLDFNNNIIIVWFVFTIGSERKLFRLAYPTGYTTVQIGALDQGSVLTDSGGAG